MMKLILVLPLVLVTAACETRTGNVLGGAAVGAAINDENRVEGAAVGAAAGLVVAAIEESNDDNCRYRNTRTGEVFIAPCGSY